MTQKLRDLLGRRELIATLIRRELKVKYKDSSLGFFWSMLNPALYLSVFYVVFTFFLPNDIPQFYIYLLCGLLPYNFLTMGLSTSTASIVANGPIVKKIYFPREVLPISTVGAALVHLGLQWIVLILVLAGTRSTVGLDVLLVIPATLVLILWVGSLGILLSALNVRARDTQHLLELVLLAWFWMTPIVYPFKIVADRLGGLAWIYLANPLTPIVLAFQRAIYNRVDTGGSAASGVKALDTGTGILPDASLLWYFRNLAIIAVGASLLFVFALWLFGRLEGNFPEEV